MRFKETIALLIMCFALQSQTFLNVYVTDGQKRPISQAIVKCQGINFSSNNLGFLRITNFKPGSKLVIHKFGFADTTVYAPTTAASTDTISFFVILRLKPLILPEVSVSSATKEEINPLKSDFVLDYELKDEQMVELLSENNLLILNSQNEIKSRSKSAYGSKTVVKDSYGDIHVITNKSAFKINLNNSFIEVDTVPIDLVKLNWSLKYCDEAADTFRVIRRYKDNNQTVAFFAISSLHDTHVRMLKEITDAERKSTVAIFANESNSFNAYLESLGINVGNASTVEELDLVREAEHMANMLEMHYTLPYYSFLKLVNDSIYLFAHDIDSMFVYDKSWNLVKCKRIVYHHLKIWGKELFVNEEKTKVYAKLFENAVPMIAEIDLQTGTLKPDFTTIETKFPRKIKIRANKVYYLAKKKSEAGYTVYSQKLQ